MAEQQSNNQGHTTADSLKAKGQALLDLAINQEPVKPDCRHSYGLHQWIKHEETLMEFCSVCKIRKDVWDEATKEQPAGNQTATEIPDSTGNQQGKEVQEVGYKKPPVHTQFKPGQSGNPKGREAGSKNFATQMRELMAGKEYTLKDEATGQTLKINAMTAMLEKTLELAIKKGDRESIRMIWEFLDGKPTQQHRLEVNGPKGYEIDPAREVIYLDQFDMAAGLTLKATKTVHTEVQTIEVTKEATPAPIVTPEPSQVAKQG